jgi:hypothetical protein
MTLQNTNSGATNTNKYIRLNSSGQLEIINSAYSANLINIADSGIVTIGTTTASTSSNLPTNNALSINNKGYIYDDGNIHFHTATGTLWLNVEDGNDIALNVQASGGVSIGNNLKFNSGYGSIAQAYGVRAWINCGYNGSSMTTRGSGNLSVSRSSTGTYAFTFGTAMPDANYCVTATAMVPGSNSDIAANLAYNVTPTTTGFTITTARYGSGFEDVTYLMVQVVR